MRLWGSTAYSYVWNNWIVISKSPLLECSIGIMHDVKNEGFWRWHVTINVAPTQFVLLKWVCFYKWIPRSRLALESNMLVLLIADEINTAKFLIKSRWRTLVVQWPYYSVKHTAPKLKIPFFWNVTLCQFTPFLDSYSLFLQIKVLWQSTFYYAKALFLMRISFFIYAHSYFRIATRAENKGWVYF